MYMYVFLCDVFIYVVLNLCVFVLGYDSLLMLMFVWMNDCNCWSVSILLENCFVVFLKYVIIDWRNSIDIKCVSIFEYYVFIWFILYNIESKICVCRL